MRWSRIAAAAVLPLCLCRQAGAQEVAQRFALEQHSVGAAADASSSPGLLSRARGALGWAKWTSLGIAAAAGAYGFTANGDADDRYAALERTCAQEPARCGDRDANGAFRDAALEAEYQDVLRLDRRSRAALLGSQIALGASVVMFILDLRDHTPPNIPYDPDKLSLARDGAGRVLLQSRIATF